MVNRVYEVAHQELSTDEQNANRHTERGLGLLEKSLRELGPARSIVLDRNNKTIAGNATLETAVALGIPVTIVEHHGDTLIAVKRLDLALDGDDDKARQLAIADNRVAEVDLDWELEALQGLSDDGLLLTKWFFEDELEALGIFVPDSSQKGEKDFERLQNEDEDLGIMPGQVYNLGMHKLIVGLSAKRGDVEVVLAAFTRYTGQKPELERAFDEFATDDDFGMNFDMFDD